MEFSKKLLIADYAVFIGLVVCAVKFPNTDFTGVLIAWVTQLGISSGAYYLKAGIENMIKVPLKVIETLPNKVLDKIDLTQVITAIIQSK